MTRRLAPNFTTLAPTIALMVLAGHLFTGKLFVQGQVCEEGSINRSPYNFVGGEPSEYTKNGATADLRIFTTLRITCSGYLNSWRFIPKQRDVSKLHLAVFRKQTTNNNNDGADNNNNVNIIYTLIGETYLENHTIAAGDVNRWIYTPIVIPFRVKRGDYLGLFYDSLGLTRDETPICFKRPPSSSIIGTNNKPTEFLLPINRGLLYQNEKTVAIGADVRNDMRVPALTAMVESATFEDDGNDVSITSSSSDESLVASQALKIAMNVVASTATTPEELPTVPTTVTTTKKVRRATTTTRATTTRATTLRLRAFGLVALRSSQLLRESSNNGVRGSEDTTPEEQTTTTKTRRGTSSTTTQAPLIARGRPATTVRTTTVTSTRRPAPRTTTTTRLRRTPTTTTTTTEAPNYDNYGSEEYGDSDYNGYDQEITSTSTTTRPPRVRVRVVNTLRQEATTRSGPPAANATICRNKPIDVLQCDRLVNRVYYDIDRAMCKPFWGCGPLRNERFPNNFETIMQCVETCYTADSVDPFCTSDAAMLSRCDNPDELRYYFDNTQRKCVTFRGCSLGYQNGNNFGTRYECNRRCSGLLRPRITAVNQRQAKSNSPTD